MAEYLSTVTDIYFLLLQCSGLIGVGFFYRELEHMDKSRSRKVVFLRMPTYAFVFTSLCALIPRMPILHCLGVLCVTKTPRFG